MPVGECRARVALLIDPRVRSAVLCLLACAVTTQEAQGQSFFAIDVEPRAGMAAPLLYDVDNNLRGVGVFTETLTSRRRPFTITFERGNLQYRLIQRLEYPFGESDNVTALTIDNNGRIGGIREIEGDRGRLSGFLLSDARATSYVDRPLPRDSAVRRATLTDSGILLLIDDLSGGGGSWAMYGSHQFDLSSLGRVLAVGEDGTVGGQLNDGRPFLRRLDGFLFIPFAGAGAVTVIGPAGHFAGQSCCDNPALYFGQPDGSVTRIPVPPGTSADPRAINRAGDLVGAINGPQPFGFIYRYGQIYDLNEHASHRDGIAVATAITDEGAIIAQSTPVFGRSTSMLLTPFLPGSPPGLSIDVRGRTVTVGWGRLFAAIDYIFEAGSGSGRSDLYRASVGLRYSITLTAPPGRYYVRVRARNLIGEGMPSIERVIDVP